MDPVTRVREHFAESIATKEKAAAVLGESIAAAGAVMSASLLEDGKIRGGGVVSVMFWKGDKAVQLHASGLPEKQEVQDGLVALAKLAASRL